MNFNQWLSELDLQIGNPYFAWLMVFALIAIAVSTWASVRRRRSLKAFGGAGLGLETRSVFSRFASTLSLVLSIVLLSFALMDIRWGKTTYEVPQKGLEVVFALDVSRSMLAQDASPNRLERAKQQIKDMVDEMAGDRVGLVVFAGEADQAVPLTSHYEDFKQVLDSVGPHSIPVGGSQLGGALKAAAEAFISKTNENKTIVLFTDGEDQESEPVKLARQLHADDGIRVFTIGLGDVDQGARIPDQQSRAESFVQHEGQQVWSKLNGRILKEIATETEGAYIPSGTKRVNMADVYHGYVAKVEQTEFETAKINAYVPRFQWFAGAALFCFLIEIWLTSRRKRKLAHSRQPANESTRSAKNPGAAGTASSGASKTVAAAIVFLLLNATSTFAQETDSVARQINQANELVRQQKTAEAIDAYNQIDSASKIETQNQLDYNLAVAHYRNSDYAAAMTLFSESAKSPDRAIAASSRYNLGNCHYAQALPQVESEPDAAIELLEESIVHYRSALRLDRANAASRSNIELARKLIKQIEDQQPQDDSQEDQPQEQDKSDKSQQDQPQENEQNDQQKSDQQKNDQQKDEQESEDQQNQSGEQKDDDSSANESNDQQDSRNGQESSEGEQGSDPPSNPADSETGQNSEGESYRDSEQNPEPGGKQTTPPLPNQSQTENQSDQPSDQDPANATDAQSDDESKQPSPEQMSGDLTADNQSEQANGQAKSMAMQNGDGDGLMTRQEALKMLQAVRDRDMLRRLQQQRRQRARRVPVERDW